MNPLAFGSIFYPRVMQYRQSVVIEKLSDYAICDNKDMGQLNKRKGKLKIRREP